VILLLIPLLDSLAGFADGIRSLLSLDSLTALAGFAHYSRWTCPVSCRWIPALLSQDSLADSLAGFVRWIRSLLTLDPPGEFLVDSRATLPGFSC
jgi:hypothetical protein